MPLTQLFIEVPGLGDNSKNLEVEGAIAVGEKVAVSVSGLPADVSTSGSELRLRVLGPMGEDVATHGEWTYDAAKKTYATTLDLASVQAFRLFFPPPPPPRPHIYPRPPAPPMPLPPPGYDPVATATAMQPPNAVNVRLVLELRDKSGSDSDSDGELVDASLIGTSSIRLNYWPADWQTATLIDLANGRVYSKEEVDAIIAEEARQRGVADATETGARIAGDAKTLASSKAYADEKAQELDSRKADLVDGKVPASQLPSYVDDVVEYDSRSAFPATGEKGKIYVALDTNKIYRWSGSEYVQVGGGDAPVLSVNGKTGAVVLSASDVGAVNRSGDTMYGGLTVRDLTVGLGRATGSTVGESSVAEGEGPTASGYNSHAEGTYTTASGEGAHAEGRETVAQNSYEHAQGFYNASHAGSTDAGKTISSIGVGSSDNARANAVEVMRDGKVYVKNVGGYDGTNPTAATDLAAAIPSTSDATPLMDGTGAAGTATTYARGDHRHPTDTSRMEASATGVDIIVQPSGQWGGASIAAFANIITERVNEKQDTISDLATIRSGAAAGATAVQPSALATVATTGDYDDLTNKPTIPAAQVNADWNAASGVAQILNKPTIPDVSGKADATSLADAYNPAKTSAYAAGDYVTYQGALYKCSAATTNPPGNFDPTKWGSGPVAVISELNPANFVQWANDAKNAVTIGKRAGNTGAGSLAVGHTGSGNGAEASGSGSLAVGNAKATSISCAAIGLATASGLYSLAAGNASAKAEGQGSVALGSSTTSSSYGSNSFAVGDGCSTYGIASIAMGYRARSGSGTGSGIGTRADRAFAWNGTTNYYHSKGEATFCINPNGGTAGFYIGDDNLSDLLLSKAAATSLAAVYDPAKSPGYAVGDYCTYLGKLYKCTTAVTTPGAWNAANWSAVAVTDEMGGGGAPKNVWYVGSTTVRGGTISGSTTTGDFVLAAGNVVVVKMSYGVNATSATLNIDGTGAKQISTRSGTTTFPQYFWSNEQAIAFVYSGTYYIPCGMATATIYNAWGLTSLSSTVSDDETKAATPKAVNTRAPKESPAFTGTPTAPTASAGTNTTQIATTAFVQAATGGKLDATERNLLAYASTTTLALETAVYRSALDADGTFPTITDTGIPTAAAYYQFELELDVPSTVPSTITGPSGWTWIDGHGLPDPADLSGGETIYISVRLDCTARTFLASVWRVA